MTTPCPRAHDIFNALRISVGKDQAIIDNNVLPNIIHIIMSKGAKSEQYTLQHVNIMAGAVHRFCIVGACDIAIKFDKLDTYLSVYMDEYAINVE